MSDLPTDSAPADYASLGLVANPFPPIDQAVMDALGVRLVTHANANAVLAAVARSAERTPSDPIVVTTTDALPDYYPRVSLNDFLRRSSEDAERGILALNIPLEMMRLGRIRGTLAELAELLAAADLELTVASFLTREAGSPDAALAEAAGVTDAEIAEVVAALGSDPHETVVRVFGPAAEVPVDRQAESDALHDAYVRAVALDPDPGTDEESVEDTQEPAAMPAGAPDQDPDAPESASPADEAAPAAGDALREYFLAWVREHLSPVVARALASYREHGESLFAQELKVTKAPRKTLAAVLRFMQPRWPHVVVLYDHFDSWGILDDATKADVCTGMAELSAIIGATGVMGLILLEGQTPELADRFADGIAVDWSMGELPALQQGSTEFDPATVQKWLDAAAVSGTSAVRMDGPELAPLVAACENDVLRFAVMAEVAFRDAASRGASTLDEPAIAAGIASVNVTESDR